MPRNGMRLWARTIAGAQISPVEAPMRKLRRAIMPNLFGCRTAASSLWRGHLAEAWQVGGAVVPLWMHSLFNRVPRFGDFQGSPHSYPTQIGDKVAGKPTLKCRTSMSLPPGGGTKTICTMRKCGSPDSRARGLFSKNRTKSRGITRTRRKNELSPIGPRFPAVPAHSWQEPGLTRAERVIR